MKMRKLEHFTRSSSSIQGQAFNVKFTDKMFETLFSSLYRYKEAAALRETFSNAVDSHNMRDRQHRVIPSHYASLTPPPQRLSKYLAPKGTRVVVHLPDDLEPWLEIKDYGIGLTLEQIIGDVIPAKEDEVLVEGNVVVKENEIPDSVTVIGVPDFYEGRLVFRREDGEIIRSPGLYTTLFSSTKEDDNDQTGAFGLGSKAPFAVSDTFTVESRMEGKIHRYLMYLNANRIPTVDLLTKDLETRDPKPEDTEEFNGITVKIPVKNSRFRSFSDELQRLGRIIRPENRPIVENVPGYFYWHSISYENRVHNTYIQPKGDNKTHYAVMGGVSYPIDLEQLEESTRNVMSKFPSSYTFFDLGTLNVPPSREDLSYDEFTRETLSQEFSLLVESVVESKVRELSEAQARGPLALFIQKSLISDSFGSGFRKLLDARFPPDARFSTSEGFKYIIPVELQRNHDETAPYRSIDKPYSLEIHRRSWGNPEDSISMSMLSDWAICRPTIAVVIEDTTRARNLKIKTAVNEYDYVVLVKPTSSYLSMRNQTVDTKAFYNSKQIHEYLCSWIGDQELSVDYLCFADKFSNVTEDIMNPKDVLFMSEMKYISPPVEKDPGLFPFDSHRFNLEKYNELSAEDVSEIIESGKRIVYIEISGYDSIHKFRNRTIDLNPAIKIRDAMGYTKFDDGKTIMEFMNFHKYIMLARRKSIPMMKKYPEVFVPIDKVVEMLIEHNAAMIDRHNAQVVMNYKDAIVRANHRMSYGLKLMQESGVEGVEAYKKAMARQETVMKNMMAELTPDVIKELQTRSTALTPTVAQEKNFAIIRNLISDMGSSMFESPLDQRMNRMLRLSTQIFDVASVALSSAGFRKLSWGKSISKRDKYENRQTMERYKIRNFVRENYKPSSLNLLDPVDKVMEAISKSIIRAS